MKNLIYFTIGNNENYVKLLEICINSIIKNGFSGDILILTNMVERMSLFSNLNVFVHYLSCENLFESSSNKLRITDWPDYINYEKFIYCDVDFVWLDNPIKIFDKIKNNEIYFCSEETEIMGEEWGGANIFTESDKIICRNKKIKAVNAGLLAFNLKTIFHIKNIYNYMLENIKYADHTLEQPYINYYVYKNKCYNYDLTCDITKDGDLHISEDSDGIKSLKELSTKITNGVIISNDITAIHFAGMPGNFDYKYGKMLKISKY
jgi:hypothetical protein